MQAHLLHLSQGIKGVQPLYWSLEIFYLPPSSNRLKDEQTSAAVIIVSSLSHQS